MADDSDTDATSEALLAGWGTPPARADFVDRVIARVDAPDVPVRARRRWLLPFALGGALGAALAVAVMQRRAESPDPPADVSPIHLRAPGVGDVVGERGTQLSWTRGADGELVLEVVEGIAWVRVADEGPTLGLVADGEQVALGRPCSRIAVERHLWSVDVSIDDVDCQRVDDAIARGRAELSSDDSR